MPNQGFEQQCDRISQAVDGAQFERLRWARVEGPMLARLVTLAQSVLQERSEFELVDEGSTSEIKRFVLKVHNNRVVAIALSLDSGRAVVQADEIDRSHYRLSAGPPLSVDFAQADEAWMRSALEQLFGRIAS